MPASASITGSWELRIVYGGFMNTPGGTTYPPGNGYLLKFTDVHYESYAAGVLADSGSYSKTRDLSMATGRVMDAIVLKNSLKVFYEIKRDTLTLYVGVIAADGAIEKFVRQ